MRKFTLGEEAHIWSFLAVNPDRLSMNRMLEKYRLEGHTDRSQSSLNNRFTKYLVHSLHSAEIDMRTKAQIYMLYRLRPTPEYLVAMREEVGAAVDEHGYVVHFDGMEEDENGDESGGEEASGDEANGYGSIAEESDGEPPMNGSNLEEVVASGDEEEVEQDSSSTLVVNNKRQASPLPVRNAKHFKTGESSSNHVDEQEMPEDEDHQNGALFQQQPLDFLQCESLQPLMDAVKESVKEVFAAEAKEMVALALDEQKKRIEAEKKSTAENEKVSMKTYLSQIKSLIVTMDSPSLDDIKQRINNAIASLDETDELIPIDSVRSVLDVALKMFGH